MNPIASAHSELVDAVAAAQDIAAQLNGALDGPPDALVVFASSTFDYTPLLEELDRACRPAVMVGASSAGEFTHDRRGVGTVSALALRSPHLKMRASLGAGISRDSRAAARQIAAGFSEADDARFPYRAALVLTDALAGRAEDFIEELTLATSGRYVIAGGGAGDDAKFSRTHVFHGAEAFSDAAVALEILSARPIGVGVGHGWQPCGPLLRATEVDGMRVVGLNGMPAVEAFERHAEDTGQVFDRADPMPFFLHNILGIDTGHGYRLRVPLAVDEDGAIHCAAEVPEQATVHIMKTTSASAAEAAAQATRAAVLALGDAAPGGALFFDCVATRLRLGDAFGLELGKVAGALGGAPFVGCNTYGQIARAERQFSGFHNCTAVVLALPR